MSDIDQTKESTENLRGAGVAWLSKYLENSPEGSEGHKAYLTAKHMYELRYFQDQYVRLSLKEGDIPENLRGAESDLRITETRIALLNETLFTLSLSNPRFYDGYADCYEHMVTFGDLNVLDGSQFNFETLEALRNLEQQGD